MVDPGMIIGLALLGLLAGSQVNRAIYRLAWEPRPIGPWSAPAKEAARRGPRPLASVGPASTSGLRDSRSASRALPASCGLMEVPPESPAATPSLGPSSPTCASRRSAGRLTCTGPGRPDLASPMALATSRPSCEASCTVHDALVTGCAISDWAIS